MPAQPTPDPRAKTRFPAYPPSTVGDDAGPALPADALPEIELDGSDLPADAEAADALGTSPADLHAEIRAEEQQRHGVQYEDDEDDTLTIDDAGAALDRRLAED